MNYVVGSAVKIKSEVSLVLGSVVTFDLYLPDGTLLLDDQAMSFSTVNTSVAFAVWQSTTSSVVGRYKFITKVVNGGFENQAKGFFYLESE